MSRILVLVACLAGPASACAVADGCPLAADDSPGACVGPAVAPTAPTPQAANGRDRAVPADLPVESDGGGDAMR